MPKINIPPPQLHKAQTLQEKKQDAARESQQTDAAAENTATDSDAPDVDADGPDAALFKQMQKMRRKKGLSTSAETREMLADSDAEAESGATTADGVTRKGSASGGGDGFDHQGRGQESLEQYLLGHISDDDMKFKRLKEIGEKDFFDPSLEPNEVELLGLRAAAHVVRCYDFWRLDGMDRSQTIHQAADLIDGFSQIKNARRVITELENSPIRDVYPLEVVLKLMEMDADVARSLRGKPLTPPFSEWLGSQKMFAGYPVRLPLPKDVRIKAFALLGGHRPGYEFAPSKKPGYYDFQVDTAGQWHFAFLAVPTKQIGRMVKECPDLACLQKFSIEVGEIGPLDSPPEIAPEEEI